MTLTKKKRNPHLVQFKEKSIRLDSLVSGAKAYGLDPDSINWLSYLFKLDPHDESESFLTPEEIEDVENAYTRVASSGYGPPNSPINTAHIFGGFEDDHNNARKSLIRDYALIGQKLKIALLRALQTEKTSLKDAILCKHDFELKILSYEKGYISGQCKVLFPKARTQLRTFDNEPGWKSEIEIDYYGRGKKSHTIFARGLCMNAILSVLYYNSYKFLNPNYEFDSKGIKFTPLKRKPLEERVNSKTRE